MGKLFLMAGVMAATSVTGAVAQDCPASQPEWLFQSRVPARISLPLVMAIAAWKARPDKRAFFTTKGVKISRGSRGKLEIRKHDP